MANSTANESKKTGSLDLDRYQRHQIGKTFEEISAEDQTDIAVIEKSIESAAKQESGRMQREFIGLRIQAQIDNERTRKKARTRLEGKFLSAMDHLLTGERTAIEVNKESGEVTLKTYTDPDVLAVGVEQYRKAVTLEEKPQPAPGMVLNLQNNTINQGTPSSGGRTFEERLLLIRQKQKQLGGGVVESEKSAEPEYIEAEIITDTNQEDSENPWAI